MINTLHRGTLMGLLTVCGFLFGTHTAWAQYNNLWIPDTLSGTNFNLVIKDSTAQLRPGALTVTGGVNNKFWGPTLFINKDDTVHMNVQNTIDDTTTLHWHGMHLPAVMDGGPHQTIPPNTTWQPYWRVMNNAATYWYHPHLHEMTMEHITKGIGGFIIVRDAQEAALALPRTYGVDDIPLALTSRRFTAGNQFVTTNTAYGDYLYVNGTPNPQVSLPKQYVRLRILNAEIERGYNLGFSDNRTFYIIANDGGLVNQPVPVTRVKMMVGERIEILVDLGNVNVGSSIDLKAYNSGQALGFPGGEPNTNGQFGSLLNNIDFTVLHINVTATTANAITALPTTLANNTYWTAADATVTRTVAVTGGQPGGAAFSFDNTPYTMDYINHNVNLNAVEAWTITNNNVFGHAFHIHDVEFKIVARNGSAANVGAHEAGWKDVVYLIRNESVTFVAKFEDYADPVHPFMYHCHFANHEDGGMMGQFVVTQPVNTNVSKTMIKLPDTGQTTSYTATTGEDADYTAIAPTLEINSNGTVVDLVTGLMWQQADGGEMTADDAMMYCDNLTLGGYTNWRLPNAHEAFSILNHQNNNPALNTTIFTTSAAEYWWTSDFEANSMSNAWATNAGGGIGNHPITETISAGGTKRFHARAVRNIAPATTLANRFVNNNNGTITDNLTGLIWQQVPTNTTRTWEQALTYAEGLTLGGASDWRLPNIKELQSLTDVRLTNPALDTNFFSGIGVKKYWSATSLPNQSTSAWYLNTQYGITTYDPKTTANYTICVKGLPTNCTLTPTVSGTANTCSSTANTYTTPATAGATYAWIVTSGTITTGQGTNTIQVQWDSGTTGTVKVIQINP
jgi:blue copper oxidase